MELSEFPQVLLPEGSDNLTPPCRAEENIHVYRNNHSYHSRHRPARRFQRHRRRTVLWHRLLRRWRPRPYRRDLADPAAAREVVISRSARVTDGVMAGLVPAIHVFVAAKGQ